MEKDLEDQIIKLTLDTLDAVDKIADQPVETLKKLFPLQAIFFTDEGLKFAKRERKIVTKLGGIYYPPLAEIIARQRYSIVKKGFVIEGELDVAKVNLINNIVDELRHRPYRKRKRPDGRIPNHITEMQQIRNAVSGSFQKVEAIADLFIGDHQDGELFIEIKSPLPNLDVCEGSKRKMLTFLTLKEKEQKKAEAWLGLYYHPCGEGMEYKHPYTKQIMDMQNQVLLGKVFWEKLGGTGTFNDIVRVASKAKELHYNTKNDQTKIF